VDRFPYDAGLIDNRRPFRELRAAARINDAARAAGDAPDFSQRIRDRDPE
jgi:hypothetical protein